jgi:hypothetical protein
MIGSLELCKLLSSSDNCRQLKTSIESGVHAFHRGLSELGRSAPIKIQSIGQTVLITRTHLENLCSWYLKGDIEDIELEYVANLLDLCSDFAYDKSIADAIFQLADPEINGNISLNNVREILTTLATSAHIK